MDDVTRALERAAEAIAEEDGDTPVTPVDRIWARAAVLAFLQAMPDFNLNASGEWHLLYTPSTLAAAIEETAAIRARGEG